MLAVNGLSFVCWMNCRVLQTLKLSIAKIIGWGRVRRIWKSVMRTTANISAGYEPLMGDVLQMVIAGAVLNVAAYPDGLLLFGSSEPSVQHTVAAG